MRTATATAALTILFLSAGAFARDSRLMPSAAAVQNANVTVINKNQSWPVKNLITVEACSVSRCIDI